MSDVQLQIAGHSYGGWKSIQITKSLEQLAHTFRLGITEKWINQDQRLPIAEGAPCTIAVDDDEIITGYVDEAPNQYTVRSHTVTVGGRSKTGDLVDCSAIYQTGSWADADLLQIATDLCDPFGIVVQSEVPVGTVFKRFSIQEGETVHECLERAARVRNLLLTTSPTGDLVLTRSGRVRTSTALEYGRNVKSGGRSGSWKERFSKYVVKSQGSGSDDFNAASSSQQSAEISDQAVTRYRPLIILAEDSVTGQAVSDRATWERNIRAGRSQRVRYQVMGWSHEGGLWEPNMLVHVIDPVVMVDAELLLVTVSLVKDEQGTRADLELTGKDAFDIQPLPAPVAKSRGAGLLDLLEGTFE